MKWLAAAWQISGGLGRKNTRVLCRAWTFFQTMTMSQYLTQTSNLMQTSWYATVSTTAVVHLPQDP